MDEQNAANNTTKESEKTGLSASTEAAPAAAPATETASGNSETSNVLQPSPSPSKKSNKMMLWLILVVIILVLGVVMWWLIGHKTKKQTTAATTAAPKDVPLLKITMEGPFNDSFPNVTELNVGETELMHDLYDQLVEYHQGTKLTPALATSWENPDNNTWVFHLRHNVKFHSGRTMTSADVKASIQGENKGSISQLLTTINSIDIPDDYTVKITTDPVDPLLLNELSNVPILDAKDTTANDPNAGTGPFMVKNGTIPAVNSIDIVAFDGFWGGRPHVRELSFTGTTQITTAQQDKDILAHKYDVGGFVLQSDEAALKQAGFKLQSAPDLNVYSLFMNVEDKSSPLNKLLVRQALQSAVDANAVIKARQVEGKPASQPVPQAVPGYNPNVTLVPYDPSKAKQLLSQAGYPNGVTLTLSYYAPADNVAQELKKEFARSGITLNLDKIADIPTIAKKTSSGQAQIWWFSANTSIFDLSDLVTSWYQGVNYDNPQVDALIKQASTTIDVQARLKLLERAEKQLADDVPAVPVYEPIYTWAYNGNLKGVSIDRVDNTPAIDWTKVYE